MAGRTLQVSTGYETPTSTKITVDADDHEQASGNIIFLTILCHQFFKLDISNKKVYHIPKSFFSKIDQKMAYSLKCLYFTIRASMCYCSIYMLNITAILGILITYSSGNKL